MVCQVGLFDLSYHRDFANAEVDSSPLLSRRASRISSGNSGAKRAGLPTPRAWSVLMAAI